MLKIGEFARICRVSTQTLRYYDTEGILCPDVIDPSSGYRFYAPEKIEDFRLIQTYKDAGFALEEIKVLLQGDSDRRNTLMARKRQEISGEVKALQNKLSLLDSLGNQRARLGELDIFEIGKQRFEDHPEVLGRWELCGRLIAPIDSDPPPPSAPLVSCRQEDMFPLICMLPNGAPWWMFCWSRGVLYTMSAYNTIIPNPYALWELDGERYMTVRYAAGGCLYQGGDPIWLLYRQTEHAALTELESRAFVDEVVLPAINDPAIVGEWVTVGYTDDPESFTMRDVSRDRSSFWIIGVAFNERNVCLRRYAQGGRISELIYVYTRYEDTSRSVRGAVLTRSNHIAEGYLLREVEGETLLFIQHKSGDYIYGGREPHWYVFRRADKNSNH